MAYFFRYGYNDPSFGEFADYRNIENFYFIKEFDPEEFLSEQYAAIYNSGGLFGRKGRTEFNHHETLTIPKEILPDMSDTPLCYDGVYSVRFNLADIWFSEEKGSYYMDLGASHEGVNVNYKYINNGSQIKIV